MADSWHDPRHDPITVTLLDTQTGERADADHGSLWYWTEGNGSCDCNRELVFGHGDVGSSTCLGGRRYLVVDATNAPWDEPLHWYNREYPRKLLESHGIEVPGKWWDD